MRRLLFVVFALCLCLCAGSQSRSAEGGALDAAGVVAPNAAGGAASVSPAPVPAGGNAAAGSAAPASEAAGWADPAFTGNPIPDTPPPGWTEEQLADLRKLELQIRHLDTDPDEDEKDLPYRLSLFPWDLNASGKNSPLCVKRVYLETDIGVIAKPGPTQFLSPSQCMGYVTSYPRKKRGSSLDPKNVGIRKALAYVAPYRGAPEETIRELDARPMLRAVTPPPVALTVAGRPMPRLPEQLPPVKEETWPAYLRTHLADVYTDVAEPGLRCYSLNLSNLPRSAWYIYRVLFRANIGQARHTDSVTRRFMDLCVPKDADPVTTIDIKQATVWKSYDEPVNGAPWLADDGFQPLCFVTDKGPLPPSAAGPYPPRPRGSLYDEEFYLDRIRPVIGKKLPDTPPPGWNEEQLAALRRLEIRISHLDTVPDYKKGPHGHPYEFSLVMADEQMPEKTTPLCVERIRIVTDAGDILGDLHCQKDFFTYLKERKDFVFTRELQIRQALVDLAPHRDAPDSATFCDLDVLPMLRSVPLANIPLGTAKGPLPKMPAKTPARGNKNRWPDKVRIHLAAAYSDPPPSEQRCYTLVLANTPRDTDLFSRIAVRTDIGAGIKAYPDSSSYIPLCVRGGAERIIIQEAKAWKGYKPVDVTHLLVNDGFAPISLVTDDGPLPSAGYYPAQKPWLWYYKRR